MENDVNMMICADCGKEYDASALCCPECGLPVSGVMPKVKMTEISKIANPYWGRYREVQDRSEINHDNGAGIAKFFDEVAGGVCGMQKDTPRRFCGLPSPLEAGVLYHVQAIPGGV